MTELNKRALYDELVDAFIVYQHRLEHPFPTASETKEDIIQRYMNDPLFHARVSSLVSGVMCIIDKHIEE